MIVNKKSYQLFSEMLFPNGDKSSYQDIVTIFYAKKLIKPLSIEINKRGQNLVDGEYSQEFDFIMSWLGNALYPLTVRMNDLGEATGIENIDEVRKRYTTEGQKIIDYYEQDALVVDYVKGCIEKVQDEKEVLQCISQSNIYQLATLCMAITDREYRLVDFPFHRRCSNLLPFNRGRRRTRNTVEHSRDKDRTKDSFACGESIRT